MKTQAAILWGVNEEWSVEEIELDGPRAGEMLVEFVATGLCHSDHSMRTGAMYGVSFPLIGGHEGGGIVREVGPEVHDFAVGDHVVTSFLPACGMCRWCSTGRQNLCDFGANTLMGVQPDGTYRRRARGREIGALSGVGSFAPWSTVHKTSVVKIDQDVPLERACVLGCGVTTGWGSAVNTAEVRPGDTVIVVGLGGIGSGAVQGARLAGAERIIVVDLVEAKREKAFTFGATHFTTSLEEATEWAREMTRGVLADSIILTMGTLEGHMINDALNAVRKGGTVVATALASMDDVNPTLPLTLFTLFQKRLLGSLFGAANPRADIPRLVSLYKSGQLLLDETVTTEYKLNEINKGYDDMIAGLNIRGVVIHDH
jgi:S-(hydroxymethyl)glutathione dehydrogenase/alcohol dehydrogenase